ncbi:hypothetical protein E2C01_037843 [Portunus trituberculatus]|uniref:Uncharacterized protein n=1 Tax=Portunus trituberculatus TaxID=210409 RepID=A0A5B7FG17_PORTR|nr:hypothetical protein [Portunus trituberculatus]
MAAPLSLQRHSLPPHAAPGSSLPVCQTVPAEEVRLGVKVVKQPLIVSVLLVPFFSSSIAEVITERNQQGVGAEELSLASVLVQQQHGSNGFPEVQAH